MKQGGEGTRCAGVGEKRVVSTDSHVVRIWDADSGAGFTTVQPKEPGINDVLLFPGSGLLLLACDAPRIEVCALPLPPPPSRGPGHQRRIGPFSERSPHRGVCPASASAHVFESCFYCIVTKPFKKILLYSFEVSAPPPPFAHG